RIATGAMIGSKAPCKTWATRSVTRPWATILRRHGMVPAPERREETTWKEFIRTHLDVLAATDFFTAEVWTCAGLITYYVLIFIRLQTRQVYLAGITPHPTDAWMRQVARNVTRAEVRFLNGCR